MISIGATGVLEQFLSECHFTRLFEIKVPFAHLPAVELALCYGAFSIISNISSSLDCKKLSMIKIFFLRSSEMDLVVKFPVFNQIIFGGIPFTTFKSTKSESNVTIESHTSLRNQKL